MMRMTITCNTRTTKMVEGGVAVGSLPLSPLLAILLSS